MAKAKTYTKYYDPESDSLWIKIAQGKEERFEEIAPGVSIEFGKNSKVIGIEILNASSFLKTVSSKRKLKKQEQVGI